MRWRFVQVVCALLTAVTVGLPAHAAPDDLKQDKKRVDAELAKTGALLEALSAKARTAATELAEANAAMPAAQERIAKTRSAVVVAETKAASAQRRADQATAAWAVTDQAYQASVRQVQEGRDRFARFAVATLHGSNLTEFNVLMAATRPQEFLDRGNYIEQIARIRRDAIDGFVAARRASKQITSEAELKRREAADAARIARAALLAAEKARQDAEQARRDLDTLAARQKKAMEAAKAEKAEVQRHYQEVKEQSERIADELRVWEGQYGKFVPILRPGAKFLMPTKGWKSSDFGNRFDPYYGVWQLHAGVDIAAGGGQPIFAAAGGTVSSAGWLGGYGNYTCLTHGKSGGKVISTCYAHQSKILVKVGDKIRGGQLIGRVGTTGASTGYHLHFEVRQNGNPVQPLTWLPGCLC
ncbi:M23 family metallopeptidase [Catellatospora sichuanensis]|uniref:M23 family metallopeptidase n=1 Tax=Catellatospora sichuanensis TaxID=1969805 RepID=UPI001181F078|nr:M23 family metallopeptidase [Catellatospora sichuanensis]